MQVVRVDSFEQLKEIIKQLKKRVEQLEAKLKISVKKDNKGRK